MADFSIPITIPDEHVAEILEALEYELGDGDPMTPAEIRAKFKKRVENQIRAIYQNYKRRNVNVDIDIT
jgi:hypothetical protein